MDPTLYVSVEDLDGSADEPGGWTWCVYDPGGIVAEAPGFFATEEAAANEAHRLFPHLPLYCGEAAPPGPPSRPAVWKAGDIGKIEKRIVDAVLSALNDYALDEVDRDVDEKAAAKLVTATPMRALACCECGFRALVFMDREVEMPSACLSCGAGRRAAT